MRDSGVASTPPPPSSPHPPLPSGGSVTRAVNGIARGQLSLDADPTVRRIYEELHALAHRKLARESGATILTSDLVNEAYLKLFRPKHVGRDEPGPWQNRAHFFGSAADAMRQVLIDLAKSPKRGRVTGITMDAFPDRPRLNPRRVAAAIDRLWAIDPELGRLAHLKLFTGITIEALAETIETSERDVSRKWTFARTWIAQQLLDDSSLGDDQTSGAPPVPNPKYPPSLDGHATP